VQRDCQRLGHRALGIAHAKLELGFGQAVALGILCNALVCLAVWISYSARTTTDRILAIVFPISAFVAAGFEHSGANMYFVPLGLFIAALFLWLVLYVPVVRGLFRLSLLHPDDLGICLLAGAGPIVVFEGFKSRRRRLRSSS